MARRIIHIEPTEEQWEVLDELYGLGTRFVASDTDEHGEPNGTLWAEVVEDDHTVRLYRVAPDGSYTYEELEGLNQGWTRYDADGSEIVEDEN